MSDRYDVNSEATRRLDGMAAAIAELKTGGQTARVIAAADVQIAIAEANRARESRTDASQREDAAPREDSITQAQDRHDWRSSNAWRGEEWLTANDPWRKDAQGRDGGNTDPITAAENRHNQRSRDAWRSSEGK